MIFLDNASTTPIFDEVSAAMDEANKSFFFNPSALYRPALLVREQIDSARRTVAKQLNADKGEIFFTSCATESNNWVLSCGLKNKRGNLVISAGEHASIFDCANFLLGRGVDVRIVRLNSDGAIDLDDLAAKLDEQTALVSVIHCSNETGAINPLAQIASLVRQKSPRALIHSDGVQAFCKVETDLKFLDVDFYTVSAHKIGGPKGVGALYIRKQNRIAPFIHGGGQESGLRSGTENTTGIIGFSAAITAFQSRQSRQCQRAEGESIATKTWQIYNLLKDKLTADGWTFNGSQNSSGYILSLSYRGIKAEVLQHMLSDEDLLIGLGSSCSAKTGENRVLAAMGRDRATIDGSIRLSLSVDTSMHDAQTAIQKIRTNLNTLKQKIGLLRQA